MPTFKVDLKFTFHSAFIILGFYKGWLSYDKMFREHIKNEPHSTWVMLHPMFYTLMFLSQE